MESAGSPGRFIGIIDFKSGQTGNTLAFRAGIAAPTVRSSHDPGLTMTRAMITGTLAPDCRPTGNH